MAGEGECAPVFAQVLMECAVSQLYIVSTRLPGSYIMSPTKSQPMVTGTLK